MQIDGLHADDTLAIEQTALVLVEAFRGTTPAWPDLRAAREEVLESLVPERLSRIARAEDGAVIGWIGGIPTYSGHVWEVHPLAVDPSRQRGGVGRALLVDLEERVRERGGLTLWVGTDDEVGRTNLGGADLFPDLLGALAAVLNLRGHPFQFYARCGFVLAGVVPDANGRGKPDILMAKRVAPPAAGRGAGAPRSRV